MVNRSYDGRVTLGEAIVMGLLRGQVWVTSGEGLMLGLVRGSGVVLAKVPR